MDIIIEPNSIDPIVTPRTSNLPNKTRVWHSCCLTADKDFCMYITQITLISFVILFCIYQLLTLKECIYQTVYTSLLTLLIGLVIPSPAIKRI